MARITKSPAAETRKGPVIGQDLADLVRAFRTLLDPYQPERHYMRGPGPKWRAKHHGSRTEVEATASLPGMAPAKAR